MGAVINAASAMQADKNIPILILVNGIDGTGGNTFSATDTEILPDNYSAAFSLAIGTRRTDGNTRSRITGQTHDRYKSCR